MRAIVVILAMTAMLSFAFAQTDERPPYQRKLTGDDGKKVADLEKQIEDLQAAGKWAESVRPAEEVSALRSRAQGEKHWEAVDARWEVETCKKVAGLPAEEQGQVGEARRLNEQAEQLHRKGQYAAAQPLYQKALDLRRKLLGEEHRETATSYNNLATNMDAQGQHAAAQPVHYKALELRKKLLGEEHPAVATSYNNLASNFEDQGHYAAAQPLFEKALDLSKRLVGEDHPQTALGYNNFAANLQRQEQYAAAQPLFQKALDLNKKLLGDNDFRTAVSYNSLAFNLEAQGQYAAAQAHFQTALALLRQLLGEDHPITARSYNNMASVLQNQGQYAAAEPLFQKALDISRKTLGDDHPLTAQLYHNLGMILHDQGQYATGQTMLERALEIRRKRLGDDHPDTANCYNSLAVNLQYQGQYAAAQPLLEKALNLRKKLLGENHAATAASYCNLASNFHQTKQYAAAQSLYQKALDLHLKSLGENCRETALAYRNLGANYQSQGQYAVAQPLLQKALNLHLKLLGADHPETVISYGNLASNELAQCRWPDAESHLVQATATLTHSRLQSAASGLDRAVATDRYDPLLPLAAVLARDGKPTEAWQRTEQHFGRGLFEDLARTLTPNERQRQQTLAADLSRLDKLFTDRIVPAKAPLEERTAAEKQLEDLHRQYRQAQDTYQQFELELFEKYDVAAGVPKSYDLPTIQKALPADAALVAWIDEYTLHYACVVRHEGPPIWVSLPGTGKDDAWTSEDQELAGDVAEGVASPSASPGRMPFLLADMNRKVKQLGAKRLTPLRAYLAATATLPAVRRLLVLPSAALRDVPLAVLADDYIVSYSPSATVFAWLCKQPPLKASSQFFAIADPAFAPKPSEVAAASPPAEGLFLRDVVANGPGAQVGLRAGDVLLQAGSRTLATLDDLSAVLQAADGPKELSLTVWRDGRTRTVTVPRGRLGVMLDQRPAAAAVRAEREYHQLVLRTRGEAMTPLPGTRREVQAIAALFPQSKTLYGPDASEAQMESLNSAGALAHFRYLHFATHGQPDKNRNLGSWLALSQIRLPDPVEQATAGKRVYDGRLTAATIRQEWRLDADLVVLSACESAQGRAGGGDGKLGFAQAFLLAGARSVVMSLWKVDDTATALLMTRFYQNLLAKREGLQAPQSKAVALKEAQLWLRNLSAREAAALGCEPTNEQERPFAHPFYWAAWVLYGDPGN